MVLYNSTEHPNPDISFFSPSQNLNLLLVSKALYRLLVQGRVLQQIHIQEHLAEVWSKFPMSAANILSPSVQIIINEICSNRSIEPVDYTEETGRRTVENARRYGFFVRPSIGLFVTLVFLVPGSSRVKDALGDTIPPAPPVLRSIFNLIQLMPIFLRSFLTTSFQFCRGRPGILLKPSGSHMRAHTV